MLDNCAQCGGTHLVCYERKRALIDKCGVVWTRERISCRTCGFEDMDFMIEGGTNPRIARMAHAARYQLNGSQEAMAARAVIRSLVRPFPGFRE